MATASAYPVQLELEAPLEVARWRPLVHWFLAIPQLVVVYIVNSVLGVLAFIAWFAILFTGAIPRDLFDFIAMALRYQWRVTSYLYFMREPYPPFEFDALSADPGTDPARLSVEYPERLSRGLIFIKGLLVLPTSSPWSSSASPRSSWALPASSPSCSPGGGPRGCAPSWWA